MKTIDVQIMDIDAMISISEHGFEAQSTQKKILSNRYEPEATLEDKVYPKTYKYQPRSVVVDETLVNIKAQGLQITRWMLIKDQQLMKLNLGIGAEP